MVEQLTAPERGLLIAGGQMGAGVGEYVLVTRGHGAECAMERPTPVDAMVVGILDQPPAFAKDVEP